MQRARNNQLPLSPQAVAYIKEAWCFGNDKPYVALPNWFIDDAWTSESVPDEDEVQAFLAELIRLYDLKQDQTAVAPSEDFESIPVKRQRTNMDT